MFKQATEGDVTGEQPGFLKVRGKVVTGSARTQGALATLRPRPVTMSFSATGAISKVALRAKNNQ
jgi:hypothetical protein